MTKDHPREPDDSHRFQRKGRDTAQPGDPENATVQRTEPSYSSSLLSDPSLNARGNEPVRSAVILQAQQMYGNRAVLRYLQRQKPSAPTPTPVAKKSVPARADLEKKYKITIEKGDKDWSQEELGNLAVALSRISSGKGKKESKALEGYRFIRWTNRAERMKIDKTYKPTGTEECGWHELDVGNKITKISMYDDCFKDPESKSDVEDEVEKGTFKILHEIGHAMQVAELRKALEEGDQDKIAELKSRSLEVFKKFVKGKVPLTENSKIDAEEAFAEAYAVFKANPKRLQKANPKLYEWFSKEGYLTGI